MSTAHEQTTRKAILCAGALVALNAVFYFLSSGYFDSHRELVGGVSVPSYSPELMTHVRMTFALASGVVIALGFVAWIRPRVIGHLLPLVLGAAHLVASISAFAHDVPSVVGMTFLVSGLLMPVLVWHSYRGSRAAWAFLIGICVAFAIAEFFGAPKIRNALGIGLWTAMTLPGLNAVVVAALVLIRHQYVERDPGST